MKKLWCNLGEWRNEIVGILLAYALFLCAPYVLRLIDPTAGAYDAGVLHLLVFATVAVLTFSFLSWIGMRVNFPTMFKYINSKRFTIDYKNLSGWQRICLALLCYFGYLLAFVAVVKAL